MAAMALFLMAGTNGFAQVSNTTKPAEPAQRPTVEQLARTKTDRMTERMKLTKEQSEQVYAATLEQLRTAESLREQAKAAKLAEAEKMKQILTTEQFMHWSQMQCHRGPRNKGTRCGLQCDKQDRPCPLGRTPKNNVKRFKADKAPGMRQGRRGAPELPAPEAPAAPEEK